MRPSLTRLWQWAVWSEGSTRPAALLRIGLAMIVWARFGNELGLHNDASRPHLAFVTLFAPAVIMMLFGWYSRASTTVTAAMVTVLYIHLARTRDFGTHHVYLLTTALWLTALTPCGRSLSVDRWLALRRGQPPPAERGPLWAQRLIAIQVAVLYFWAAYDKTEAGYFTGERMQALFVFLYGGPGWLYGSAWFPIVCRAFAWATVIIEYSLSFGLFVRRLRFPLMLVGLFFHGVLYMAMSVSTFTATILLLYLAFVDPDEVHRGIDKLLAPGGDDATGSEASAAT